MAKPTKVIFCCVIESEMLNKVLLEKIVLRNESHIFVLVLFHTSFSNGALFIFNSLLHGSTIDTFLHPLNISIDSLTVDDAVERESKVPFNAVSSAWATCLHVLYKHSFCCCKFPDVVKSSPGNLAFPRGHICTLQAISLSCDPRTTQPHTVCPPKAS